MKRLRTSLIFITAITVFSGSIVTHLPVYGTPPLQCIKNTNKQLSRHESPLKHWTAGQEVSLASIRGYGIDRCFVIETISDDIFRRIYGKSFKKECTTPRTQLCYLKVLHYNAEGKILMGEMICHRDISHDLIDIFHKLFEAKYPIERMTLIDDYNADDEASMKANNTSCFNYRNIAGSKSKSKHSLGRAIDINPLYNPYVKHRSNGTLSVKPEEAMKYANRSRSFTMKIDKDDLCYKEFIKHGFTWGGSWRTVKDYQHFEK